MNRSDVMLRWADRLDQHAGGQCRGRLAMGTQRCCLGVITDMLIEDGVVPMTLWHGGTSQGYRTVGSGLYHSTLPRPVGTWMLEAGIEGLVGDWDITIYEGENEAGQKVTMTAMEANDVHELTFPQIAILLRRMYGGDQ